MKVTGSSPSTAPAARSAPSAGTGFSLAASPGAATIAAPAASAVSGVAGVSALMALQGVEDVTERRRRAIRRGSSLLDRLEDLKLGVLEGRAPDGDLDRLGRAAHETRGDVDGLDPALNSVLDQIDLRVAVELAKGQMRRTAP